MGVAVHSDNSEAQVETWRIYRMKTLKERETGGRGRAMSGSNLDLGNCGPCFLYVG